MVTIQALGGASAKGTRPYQQDTYTILTPEEFLPAPDTTTTTTTVNNNDNKQEQELAFFAVYDGHGSDLVSNHASQNLPRLLSHALTQSQSSSSHNPMQIYQEAIKTAIRDQESLLTQSFKHGEEDIAFSGSTLALALLDVKNHLLVSGNLGDSKVLLGILGDGEGGKVEDVVCLSRSHKPANPDEKHRIEDAGGSVIRDCHEIPRIGALNMSRALGDLQYKTPLTNLSATNPETNEENPLTQAQAHAGVEPCEHQGDFLSSEPYIAHVNLEQGKKYVLALVTDGVTDSPNVDDQGVLQTLGKGFQRGIRGEAVVRETVDEITEGIQSDNATCVGVFLQ